MPILGTASGAPCCFVMVLRATRNDALFELSQQIDQQGYQGFQLTVIQRSGCFGSWVDGKNHLGGYVPGIRAFIDPEKRGPGSIGAAQDCPGYRCAAPKLRQGRRM